MRIALLTKYGDMAASTRQRFRQYRPFLEAVGFDVDEWPLLDDDYLKALYGNGGRDNFHVAKRYLGRMRWLASRTDVDLIWLHCEVFPYLPSLFERLVRLPGKPIVFDYDDAIFHNYDLHRNPLIRNILGRKLHTTIAGAEVAFCGNAYLADYARPLCERTEIVPTVVDVEAFRPRCESEKCGPHGDPVSVGWIGSPSTWTDYMAPMLPLFLEVSAQRNARLVAVGAGSAVKAEPGLEILPWTEDTEVARIQEMDIGIMPLTDTPWARGKCGYKLIQYMACGLPVIASPVGVNSEIVEDGVNGFLATTEAEWRAALDRLIADPDLRKKMGDAGRAKVEREYSLQVWGPRVAQMLRQVAEEDPTS